MYSSFIDLVSTSGATLCARPRSLPRSAKRRAWTGHTTPREEFVLTTKCLEQRHRFWRRVVCLAIFMTVLSCCTVSLQHRIQEPLIELCVTFRVELKSVARNIVLFAAVMQWPSRNTSFSGGEALRDGPSYGFEGNHLYQGVYLWRELFRLVFCLFSITQLCQIAKCFGGL